MTTNGMRRMRIPLTATWGIRLALATAAISGISVWLNATGQKQVADQVLYTTLKNLVAAAILVAGAWSMGGGTEVRRLTRRDWGALALVGLIGGSIPFALFFTGLAMEGAAGAAFIQKTLFAWVAILAVPFLGELGQLGLQHSVARNGLATFGTVVFHALIVQLGQAFDRQADRLHAIDEESGPTVGDGSSRAGIPSAPHHKAAGVVHPPHRLRRAVAVERLEQLADLVDGVGHHGVLELGALLSAPRPGGNHPAARYQSSVSARPCAVGCASTGSRNCG